MVEPSNVTQLLNAAQNGDRRAATAVMAQIYEELRRLASAQMLHERANHTLQPTALVHEAYLRLVGDGALWDTRAHFYGAAARAMRRVLVDYARERARKKRGGGAERHSLSIEADDSGMGVCDVVALDTALTELFELHELQGRIVELKYFGGLRMSDIAQTLGASKSTVEKECKKALMWLRRELGAEKAR